jgi:hypothetical protein
MDTQVKRSTSTAPSGSKKYLSFKTRSVYPNEFKERSQRVHISDIETEQYDSDFFELKGIQR